MSSQQDENCSLSEFDLFEQRQDYPRVTASAVMVNRTHRIVRERAKTMQARRSRIRSLWIPLGVCAGLLATVLFALWSMFDDAELTTGGIPDSSQQMLMLLMWCLPASAAILAVVWFRRAGARAENGGIQ